MLSVAHAATGALIASKLPNPLIYIPLAVAAHFLEDWIPHWDVGTGLTNGKRTKTAAFVMEIVDLILTVVMIYFFWQNQSPVWQTHVWFGALAALSPDLLATPNMFLGWQLPILKHLDKFHDKVHFSTPNIVVGLLPQVLVLVVIWFLR